MTTGSEVLARKVRAFIAAQPGGLELAPPVPLPGEIVDSRTRRAQARFRDRPQIADGQGDGAMDDDPAMVGDPIMAAVAFMIARPGSADRVLRNHARNDSGHCR